MAWTENWCMISVFLKVRFGIRFLVPKPLIHNFFQEISTEENEDSGCGMNIKLMNDIFLKEYPYSKYFFESIFSDYDHWNLKTLKDRMKKRLTYCSRERSDDGVANSTSMPTVASSLLLDALYTLADVGGLFAVWWRSLFAIANAVAIVLPLGFSIGPPFGTFISHCTSCTSCVQPSWNGFFLLLTIPKRFICLKDYGQNNVYFFNRMGTKIPHMSGSKWKKIHGK